MRICSTGNRLLPVALAVGMVALAHRAQAYVVYGWAYCKPAEEAFAWDEDNNFIRPYTQQLFAGQTVTLTAVPERGWCVDSWWMQHVLPMDDAKYVKIDGSQGKLSFDYAFEPDVGVSYFAVKFRYLNYSLKYASQIGGILPSGTNCSYEVKYPLEAPSPVEGMTFVGWKSDTGKVFGSGDMVSGSSFAELDGVHDDSVKPTVTLTAMWEAKSYSVTKAAVNCSVEVASACTYTNELAISWQPAEEIGYAFTLSKVTVFATNEQGQALKTFQNGTSGTYRMSPGTYFGQVFVKAEYERTRKSYAVDVVAGEHGQVSKTPVRAAYEHGETVTIEATPDAGYAFEKWNDGSDLSPREITVTSAASYRATFTNRVFTMLFDPVSGTCETPSKRVRYLDPIGELPKATREGHVFMGWWTDETGGVQITTITGEGDRLYNWTHDIELFAHWEAKPSYQVEVSAEPKDGEGGTVRVEGGSVGGRYEEGTKVTLTAEANEGYSFWHWTKGTKDGDEVSTSASYEFVVSANGAYVASFTGNVYQVAFDAGEGVASTNARPQTYGQAYGELPTAAMPGDFELDGWYTAPQGGEPVTPETVFRSVGGQTVYAHWRAIPVYYVEYDGNGATSGEMERQKAYCGVATNLTANAYVRGGHKFTGWLTNKADVAVSYTNCARILDVALTNETLTLFAQWTPLTYSEALHCDSLDWDVFAPYSSQTNPWRVTEDDTGLCQAKGWLAAAWLVANITTNGTLTFKWRGDELEFWVGPKSVIPDAGKSTVLKGNEGEWNEFTTNVAFIADGDCWIHMGNHADSAAVSVANVKWTPKGTHPEPADGTDNVTIAAATVAGDTFSLSFEGNAAFDYELWANPELTDAEGWKLVERKPGDATVTFEPAISPDKPQMFYRIETVQKKD